MKVVIYGSNGQLGPHVVKALEGHVDLRLTDLEPFDTPHEMMPVDVSDPDAVTRAAEGMDAIINLSVLRPHRQIAFDVNTMGCYNIMRAAVEHGIPRVINTGPHFTVQGAPYEAWDYNIGPDVPPKPSTNLYALSKGLGQEICRIFAAQSDVYVLCYLFYIFCYHDDLSRPGLKPPISRNVARCSSGILAGPDHRSPNPAIAVRSLQHLCKPTTSEILKRKSKTHSGVAAEG